MTRQKLPKTKTPASASGALMNSVANTLRDQIQSGYYKAGDWLPTERALAEELGVDRRVVRMAINQLVRNGYAIREPHCRPIVVDIETGMAAEASLEVMGHDTSPPNALTPSPSNFIALLMCHGSEQFERAFNSQQRIFWGMNQVLAEAGQHTVFLDIKVVATEQENAVREAEQLRYIVKHGFGGVVFYPYAYRSNRELVEEVAATIPLVTIDRQVDFAHTDFVGADNYNGVYDAITHLIDQGHERIAYITKNELIRPVQDRIQGYIAAMHDANLVELVLPIPSHDSEQEWIAVDAVFRLAAYKRPTAVAVFNDYSAMDVVQHLETLGLSVPDDVAVTGFDDIVSTLPNGVGLTTVAQPYEEIGRKAAELLLERAKDLSAPTRTAALPTQLIVRESSKAPP